MKKDRSVETEQTASDDSSGKNQPLKVIVFDDVSASIFARQHQGKDELRTFYSVSFSRSYLDKASKRQYVKTFNPDDLEKIVTVAKQAEEYIGSLPRARD